MSAALRRFRRPPADNRLPTASRNRSSSDGQRQPASVLRRPRRLRMYGKTPSSDRVANDPHTMLHA
ncbi:hypothetical protein HMPREF0972_00564 [Actinomyces sp. oral taxon 848 str. F0332]|nr:hypothetical protein HMPREF0972_00564 [Actinomyces sp. oral taxon 848 str. F0332]